MRTGFHELGDGAAIARPFEDVIADQRHRLRMVELDPAFEPAARHDRGHGEQQLVLFAWRKMHDVLSSAKAGAGVRLTLSAIFPYHAAAPRPRAPPAVPASRRSTPRCQPRRRR